MKVISVLLVLSASVLAGATAEPIELTQLIGPLAAVSNAMGWIGTAPGSAVVQRSQQGQEDNALVNDEALVNCPTAQKEELKVCVSKVNEMYFLNETFLNEIANNPCGSFKALDAVAVCGLPLKQCIIFSAKDVDGDVAKVCAVSSSKRNSDIDAVMKQVRITCPGVEVGHITQYSKLAWDKICGSGGVSTVLIVVISVAVVVVLAVAVCVVKSLKRNATAATETKAGRVANMPFASPA
jgi:hypothetical protein